MTLYISHDGAGEVELHAQLRQGDQSIGDARTTYPVAGAGSTACMGLAQLMEVVLPIPVKTPVAGEPIELRLFCTGCMTVAMGMGPEFPSRLELRG